MDPPSEQIQSELESFRAQWRAEVSARASSSTTATSSTAAPSSRTVPSRGNKRTDVPTHRKTHSRHQHLREEEDDFVPTRTFEEPLPPTHTVVPVAAPAHEEQTKEPETALEFYERAVEKETSGKLGDSLQLYRRAFRMDSAVDQTYKKKHFPARPKPPQSQHHQATTAHATAATPNAAAMGQAAAPALSIPDLIASFGGLSIEGLPPEVEGVDPPPCPIASMPDEIIIHILRDVAVADVGDFARLSRVCKRLAYLVATEEQIWRRVCRGPEFGFGAMHHDWQLGVAWEPLPQTLDEYYYGEEDDCPTVQDAVSGRNGGITYMPSPASLALKAAATSLLHPLYASSYRAMFRHRPRIRFNGCYISTVNYIRPGAASGHQITWNSPVHIVTYYRYLRFFRDGGCLSLLTIEEPANVVHHLSREALSLHKDGANPHLPSAPLVKAALKGRWHMSAYSPSNTTTSTDDSSDFFGHDPLPSSSSATFSSHPQPPPFSDLNKPDSQSHHLHQPHQPAPTHPSPTANSTAAAATAERLAEAEGDIFIETQGVGPKYIYRMELSLGNSGLLPAHQGNRRKPRNNKLLWRGHWSYNKLTDDWAEFGLKHYQPFFFSRVRSYGLGE